MSCNFNIDDDEYQITFITKKWIITLEYTGHINVIQSLKEAFLKDIKELYLYEGGLIYENHDGSYYTVEKKEIRSIIRNPDYIDDKINVLLDGSK